jgi:uncharacterized protein with PIN domain
MSEKCESCNEKIEMNEIGKLEGTIIKLTPGKRTEFHYLCSQCQKQGKEKEFIKVKK